MTKPETDRRAQWASALWEAAEQNTIAEWICCDPIDPKHGLCVAGGKALEMLRALIVDDPEAYKPAPLTTVALELAAVSVPPPATRADDRAAEEHRLALSEALGLGTVAPWDAIHDRVTELGLPPLDRDPVARRLGLLAAYRAAVLTEAADELGRMDYDTDSHDYGYDTYRDAWNGGVMDGADLLRRLADESAVVPPPALTEEGRLRAQVEVLQQDAERDQGLAKVGARCMREGHQGLIEGGRLVLEGWRFALSTALDLGTGAPWEAIHERVKELTAAVSGPCVAGEQQNETPEAETQQPPIPCNAVHLRVHHAPHGWEPQPGMDRIPCPGYPLAAGARQDGAQP